MNNKITYHREGDYFIPDLCLHKQLIGILESMED